MKKIISSLFGFFTPKPKTPEQIISLIIQDIYYLNENIDLKKQLDASENAYRKASNNAEFMIISGFKRVYDFSKKLDKTQYTSKEFEKSARKLLILDSFKKMHEIHNLENKDLENIEKTILYYKNFLIQKLNKNSEN